MRQAGQTAAIFTTVKAATTTAPTSAPNPSLTGQSVTFMATVTVAPPGAGTPTGVVTFTSASGALGIGNLTDGVATFSTASLPGGSHVITAVTAATPTLRAAITPSHRRCVIMCWWRRPRQQAATWRSGGSASDHAEHAECGRACLTPQPVFSPMKKKNK